MSEWLIEVAEIFPGLVGCVGAGYVFFRRRADAQWLERMKAEIGHDVAEKLKVQESRLRVEAELKLRLHDRSWQLLRDVLDASLTSHGAIRDLTLAAGSLFAGGKTDPMHVDATYERVLVTTNRLQALAATAPPDCDIGTAIRPIKEAASLAISLMTRDLDKETVAHRIGTINDSLDSGLAKVHERSKAWNVELWRTSDTLTVSVHTKQLFAGLAKSLEGKVLDD